VAVPILENSAIRSLAVPLDVETYHELGRRGLVHEKTELSGGVVVSKMSKDPPHASVVGLLFERLASALRGRFHVRKEDPLTIAEQDSEPEPDIAVVEVDPRHYRDRHPTGAHLVIEVAATLAVDREKARIYSAAGIPEYWLIDLSSEETEVYTEPGPEGYRTKLVVAASEALSPRCAPDLAIRLSELLA
jgi:Uma2 family endonuclease